MRTNRRTVFYGGNKMDCSDKRNARNGLWSTHFLRVPCPFILHRPTYVPVPFAGLGCFAACPTHCFVMCLFLGGWCCRLLPNVLAITFFGLRSGLCVRYSILLREWRACCCLRVLVGAAAYWILPVWILFWPGFYIWRPIRCLTVMVPVRTFGAGYNVRCCSCRSGANRLSGSF